MQPPILGPEHKKLERLIGEWRGVEKLHPSPFDPKGGVAEATVVNRGALFGFAVVQDYEQRREEKPTHVGHGVFRFDNHSKRYVMHWWDNMGATHADYQGEFMDDTLRLMFVAPAFQSRATFVFQGDSAYHFEMSVSPDGTMWLPFMDGEYTKVH